jgi:hypothetical protein
VSVRELEVSEEAITLNLFEDEIALGIHDRTVHTGAHGFVWLGHVDGEPLSSVSLSVVNDAVVGDITIAPGRQYLIRPLAGGGQVVIAVDPTSYPSERDPSEPVLSPESVRKAALSSVNTDDCGRIDMMVVYTAAARVGAGSADAMLAQIYLAIEETNQSFINSSINTRVRLVHTEEVSYTESGNILTDRNRLQTAADGFLDNVLTLRNTYGADVVTMLVENGGGYCGISNIMTTVSTAFAPFAFDVVARNCATGYFSFGHELGHIAGFRHDWYVDDTNNSPYTYNHGLCNPAGSWRTIMAYNNGCVANSANCTRIQFWSNPAVNYSGSATGVAAGTSTACTAGNASNPACDANNALAFNNDACAVANFRATSPGAADVWIPDTWDDSGGEPDPLTAGEDMWESPGIWVRNDQDVSQVHLYEHQNPEFGQTNWVYALLHNGSNSAIAGTARFYWADASIGLAWASGGGQWTQFGFTLLTVPAHSDLVAEVPWTNLPGTGHFCLICRWDSPIADPMSHAETSDINGNVINNNNIAWHNVNIVDLVHDGDVRAGLFVRNLFSFSSAVDLLLEPRYFASPRATGPVRLKLSSRLFQSWVSSGAHGHGTVVDFSDSNTVRMVADSAAMTGIPVGPSQQDSVTLVFRDSLSVPGKYGLAIVERQGGQRVGGITYQATVPAPALFTLSGLVTNRRGLGLAGIRAKLYARSGGVGPWTSVSTAHTAASGAYRFSASPGTYRVCFDDSTGVFRPTCFDSTNVVDNAISVPLLTASAWDIDVALDSTQMTAVYPGPPNGTSRIVAVHPNPAFGRADITYELSARSEARLDILDVMGRIRRTWTVPSSRAGRYVVQWAAEDNAGRHCEAGIYFVRLSIQGRSVSRRAIVLR